MSALLKFVTSLVLALVISLSAGSGARADRRVALVIGNARYQHAGIVPDVVSDVNAVAGLLEKAGFDTIDRRSDLGINEFMQAISDFAVLSFNADIAVIYFSGYGLTIDDGNYLVAADAKISSVPDSVDEFVPLDWILLAVAARKLNLVIVDACRENPFRRVSEASSDAQGASLGLADVKLNVHNTLIALAAKSGSVSYDGDGPNSPFATAVVKYIGQPGLDIRSALGKVRDEVLRTTGNRQEPYVFGSLDAVHVVIAPTEVTNSRSSGESAANEAVPATPAAEPSPRRKTAKDESANLDVQLVGQPFDTATRRPVEITDPPKRPDARENLPPAERVAPPAAAEVPNSRSSGKSAANEAVPSTPAVEPSPRRKTARDEPANLDVQLDGQPFDTATRRPVEITEPPKRPDTRENLPLAEKAAPPLAAEVPDTGFSGTSASNEAAPPAPASQGTEAATLTADEICRRDGERLERLRTSRSWEEVADFADELGCTKLLPQVLDLMARLARTPAAAEVPNTGFSGTSASNEAAPPAPASQGTEAATLTADEICRRDGERLERLRTSRSWEEVARFADELGCTKLLPQVLDLMARLGTR